jgi:hypothetical protein
MQASFEETVDILFRAATYAERDSMSGVSENIMMGQLCPVGTGAFDLLMDEKKLEGVCVWGGGGGTFDPGMGEEKLEVFLCGDGCAQGCALLLLPISS